MSAAPQTQRLFDEFAAGFLLPLLEGGTVRTGRALPPALLASFVHARPSESEVEQALFDALHAAANALAPADHLRWPAQDELALAMAAHNLALSTDPSLDRTFSRAAIPTIRGFAATLIDRVGPPPTRSAALTRHALLDQFAGLTREDVLIRNWAYTYRYFGRPVPGNALLWPRLRMVRQQRERRTLRLLLGSGGDQVGPTQALFRRLIPRSPITAILRADEPGALSFGLATLSVLSDDVLRHGIVHEVIRRGSALAAPISRALEELASAQPPPNLLYYGLVFAYDLHAMLALDTGGGKAREGWDPARMAATAPALAATLPALLGSPDDLFPLLELGLGDLARLRERAQRIDAHTPAEQTRRAAELVKRARPPSYLFEEAVP